MTLQQIENELASIYHRRREIEPKIRRANRTDKAGWMLKQQRLILDAMRLEGIRRNMMGES